MALLLLQQIHIKQIKSINKSLVSLFLISIHQICNWQISVHPTPLLSHRLIQVTKIVQVTFFEGRTPQIGLIYPDMPFVFHVGSRVCDWLVRWVVCHECSIYHIHDSTLLHNILGGGIGEGVIKLWNFKIHKLNQILSYLGKKSKTMMKNWDNVFIPQTSYWLKCAHFIF